MGIVFTESGGSRLRRKFRRVEITEKDLSIEGDTGPFETSWKFARPEPDLLLATLTLTAPREEKPPAIEVRWNFPAVGLAGIWASDYSKQHFDHQGLKIESRAVLRAPLLMYLGADDLNRVTISASDTLKPLTIGGGVKEEDVNIHGSLKMFAGKEPPLEDLSDHPPFRQPAAAVSQGAAGHRPLVGRAGRLSAGSRAGGRPRAALLDMVFLSPDPSTRTRSSRNAASAANSGSAA